MTKTPNYEWYSNLMGKWVPVYVDLVTGEVWDVEHDFQYLSRWSQFEEWSEFEEGFLTRPIKNHSYDRQEGSLVTRDWSEDFQRYVPISEEEAEDDLGFTPKGVSVDSDPVNSPSHYGQGSIEAIEYIEDFLTREEYIGYLRGNIAKYLHRFLYKGKPLQDLEKAQWYLNRLMYLMEVGG